MKQVLGRVCVVVFGAVLVSCGGDQGDGEGGAIVSAQRMGTVTAAQIDKRTAASGVQGLTGKAACDVDVHYVVYATRDPRGAPAVASTAVYVPSGGGPNCNDERPLIVYAHGTTIARSFNMADLSIADSSGVYNNAAGAEGSEVMAFFAAQGYIVVAPNYLGYDASSLNYHPYLNAEAQALDVIDALRAAKAHLADASPVKPSSKLFLTGYSQGGYVAMATDKVIQRDHASEFSVTGAVPMSGPYNLVGASDLAVSGTVSAGATIFSTLLLTSYQESYGDMYTVPSDVYQRPFDATSEALFPTDTPLSTLLAQGKLPAGDPSLTRLWGAGGLLTDRFKAGYAASPFRKALVTNTLLGSDGNTRIAWAPKHPMAVCGGAQDPTVFWAVNGSIAASTLSTATLQATAYNLEDRSSLPPGPAVDQLYAGFQLAKQAAGGNLLAEYHGRLVPPFCTALARGFFAAL